MHYNPLPVTSLPGALNRLVLPVNLAILFCKECFLVSITMCSSAKLSTGALCIIGLIKFLPLDCSNDSIYASVY